MPDRVPYEIGVDELYPRDEQHRWRVYARRGDDLEILCATGSPGGIGEALVRLDLDEREAAGGRLYERGALGVLDVVEGRWLVLPWQRPDIRASFGPPPVPLAEARGWTGRLVRSRSRGKSGLLWRVGPVGPHDRYRLTPLHAGAGVYPISRTERELDDGWEVVSLPQRAKRRKR